MKVRKYQQDVLDNLEAHLAFSNKAVIPLPGGGGKSVLISSICKKNQDDKTYTVILTNISALIPQLASHLDSMGVQYNIVKAGDKTKWNPDAYITLVMEQSFHSKSRKSLDVKCDVLLKDEFNIGVGGKRYEDIVDHLNPNTIVGFTFTPIDEAGYIMQGFTTDDFIDCIDISGLIKLGYLVPLKVYIPQWSQDIDYSEVGKSGNDYSGVQLDKIINTDSHNKMIIDSMNHMNAKEKKTLVYASSIEHADKLYDMLLKAGYDVGKVHSKCDSKNNEDVVKSFVKDVPISIGVNPITCIVSVSSLTIGFDAPNANLLVMCRPTKVLRLQRQILARASRPSEGKEYAEVLDLCRTTEELGFLEDPIPMVEYGNRKELKEKLEKLSNPVIGVLANKDEPVEINRKIIVDKIIEINNKRLKSLSDISMEDLGSIFELSREPLEIINIANEISNRVNGINTKSHRLDTISEEWNIALDDYPDFVPLLLRSLKTRCKNIVKTSKGLYVLGPSTDKFTSFCDFITSKAPFIYAKKKDDDSYSFIHDGIHVEIDDQEIPY